MRKSMKRPVYVSNKLVIRLYAVGFGLHFLLFSAIYSLKKKNDVVPYLNCSSLMSRRKGAN